MRRTLTMMKCKGKFFFGEPVKRKLPEGWKLITSPVDFAHAISPEGIQYYLTTTHVYPRKKSTRNIGMLKKGEYFIDIKGGFRI